MLTTHTHSKTALSCTNRHSKRRTRYHLHHISATLSRSSYRPPLPLSACQLPFVTFMPSLEALPSLSRGKPEANLVSFPVLRSILGHSALICILQVTNSRTQPQETNDKHPLYLDMSHQSASLVHMTLYMSLLCPHTSGRLAVLPRLICPLLPCVPWNRCTSSICS